MCENPSLSSRSRAVIPCDGDRSHRPLSRSSCSGDAGRDPVCYVIPATSTPIAQALASQNEGKVRGSPRDLSCVLRLFQLLFPRKETQAAGTAVVCSSLICGSDLQLTRTPTRPSGCQGPLTSSGQITIAFEQNNDHLDSFASQSEFTKLTSNENGQRGIVGSET